MTDTSFDVSVEGDATSTPFDGLPLPLRTALERRGFTHLTEVQEAVREACGEKHDLRISSQTGSGKTVAIGLVLAERLIAEAADQTVRTGPSVLVIAPTRELADQVRQEFDWLFADVRGVRTECVTGGTSVMQERRRLARVPRILVGTPGRLLDHVRTGALDCSAITQLVLDEADQMLDMGFREELDAILESLPAERRTHMVSATFPPDVLGFMDRFQADPLHVEGTELGRANTDIEHVACLVHPRDRFGALVNLLLIAGGERTLVFVRTRQDTTTVAEKLAEGGIPAMPLSGDLAQSQRTRTLNAFKNGLVSTLVATDVAARGIDVPDVSRVVHFELPMDGAVYTHRSGRTGRAGNKGSSVVLVPPSAERRMRRIVADAGVEVTWRDLPSAAQVRDALDRRADTELSARLDGGDPPNDAQLEAARTLLDGRDPADVVARLLAMTRPSAPCEPVEIEAPAARRPRDPRPSGPRPQRASSYARFSINWGARQGATPKRLVAHVCRRGGIAGHQVGAIRVTASATMFEIDASVADRFGARVRTRDPRDPHLTIRPAERARQAE